MFAKFGPKHWWFAGVTLVFVILDQWTKYLIRLNIPHGRGEIPLIDGFLSLVHAENRGAAFGMGSNWEYRMYLFAVFTVLAVGMLLKMLQELPADDRFQSIGLGLITSGAIGNAIDRGVKQQVTDFIRVYTDHATLKPKLIEWVGTNEWPSFNVADAAIVIGLGMFFVHWMFLETDDEDLTSDPPAKPLPDDDQAAS